MKLYSADQSPFAARVKIALRHKNLAFESLGLPAAGLKSAEFLALNPMGKIPVLVLANGSVIVESETILEYLDDAHPERPLRPATPIDRARMRTIMRVTDNYVTPPTARLFEHLDPNSRDEITVNAELSRMREGLSYLNQFVADSPQAMGLQMTLADCCLFPSLHLCEIVAKLLGVSDILKDTPRLGGYFFKARAQSELARVYEEIEAALRASQH